MSNLGRAGTQLNGTSPRQLDLSIDNGNQGFAVIDVEDRGPSLNEGTSANMVSENDLNVNQPQLASVTVQTTDGLGLLESFVNLQAEDGPTRFFNLKITPSNSPTNPTMQLSIPDSDIKPTAGVIVAYLEITAGSNGGIVLPQAIYKIPLYAVS